MQRNPAGLVGEEYDVLIIGGGAFGAAAARDAALRGLSTALIERHDFGGAPRPNVSRWSMAASAICSTRICRACGHRATSGPHCCASLRTWCSLCRSPFRPMGMVGAGVHFSRPAHRIRPADPGPQSRHPRSAASDQPHPDSFARATAGDVSSSASAGPERRRRVRRRADVQRRAARARVRERRRRRWRELLAITSRRRNSSGAARPSAACARATS